MIERKAAVLARLLRASWMADAGWSPARIAAHYQGDRDWRAAVRRLRRMGAVPTVQAVSEYQRGAARRRGYLNDGGSRHWPFDAPDLPIRRASSTGPGNVCRR